MTDRYSAAISTHVDHEAYLDRIRYTTAVTPDLETLSALQLAHLRAVPFENLDVVAGVAVRTDTDWSLDKVVDRRRGGWCFEVNGAFSALLTALGFQVQQLAAAVLLSGPTVIADHLCLEVTIDDEPFLVDVGFGRSFTTPLRLNRRGQQDGGIGPFEFLASPHGTTLTEHVDGVPEARYRFRRAHHDLVEFNGISDQLRTDPDKHWRNKPFATRLLDDATDRVTLTHDTLKTERGGNVTEQSVPQAEWADTLAEWFDMTPPEVVLAQIERLAD